MSRIVRIVTRSGHTARVFPARDIAPVISLLPLVYPGPEMNINSLSLQIYTVIIKLAIGSDRSRPSHIFHAPQKCPPPPPLSLSLPPCNKRPTLAARFCVCEQDHRYDSAGALLTRGTSIRAIRSIEEENGRSNRRVVPTVSKSRSIRNWAQ